MDTDQFAEFRLFRFVTLVFFSFVVLAVWLKRWNVCVCIIRDCDINYGFHNKVSASGCDKSNENFMAYVNSKCIWHGMAFQLVYGVA